ncbi:MAG: hypothetical protein WCF84_01670, partial [Anaerolineae bacterium]
MLERAAIVWYADQGAETLENNHISIMGMTCMHIRRSLTFSRLYTWVGLISLGLVVFAINALYVYAAIPLSDFVSFWSAGRWVLQGRDPYTLYWLYPLWLTFPLIPLGA